MVFWDHFKHAVSYWLLELIRHLTKRKKDYCKEVITLYVHISTFTNHTTHHCRLGVIRRMKTTFGISTKPISISLSLLFDFCLQNGFLSMQKTSLMRYLWFPNNWKLRKMKKKRQLLASTIVCIRNSWWFNICCNLHRASPWWRLQSFLVQLYWWSDGISYEWTI